MALYKQEIRHPEQVRGLFELFAGRIAAEIENHELNQGLAKANEELRAHQLMLELRVQRRTVELESRRVALRELCSQVVVMFHHRTGAISLHLEIDDAVPEWVLGDSTRLRQILVNLLGNAFKFTRAGRVTLAAQWRDGLQLSVTDPGEGIAPDRLAVLFDRLTQADTSVTRKHGGTGLCLAICRGLADAMGGNIRVLSEPGQGSSFTVWLPLVATEPLAPNAPREAQLATARLRVLVAEDNSVDQMVINGLLARYQITPTMVANGALAVDAVQQGDAFDIVFMDCEMPVMDGYEATQAIRQLEQERRLAPVKIVVLTAHVLEEELRRCRESGMDQHLAKPVSLDDLFDIFAGVR